MRHQLLLLPIFLSMGTARLCAEGKGGAKSARPAAIPDACLQLIVATCPDWGSERGTLLRYERSSAKSAWKRVDSGAVSVLFGRNGLVWGRGILPVPDENAEVKTEKDGRAPAGCFWIGKMHGYAAAAPGNSRYPYNQVTAKDCWVDDPTNPFYNKHVEVDLENPPKWYEKQKMRLGDPTYEWLLEICHNTHPVVAGAGSGIFFHKVRAANRPSAGCTVMPRENLLEIITWVNAASHPCYVLLPVSEYVRLHKTWKLPSLPAPATVPQDTDVSAKKKPAE